MNKDLRHFISHLDSNSADSVARIQRPVYSKFEIASVVHKLQTRHISPVLLFENVKGHSMPLVMNLCATRQRIAQALGTTVDQMLKKCADCVERPVKPVTVESGPVKDVIATGGTVDLAELPITWQCEKDSGPYINAGVTILRDPDTGIYNAGGYIHAVHDRRTLGMAFSPLSHAYHIFRKAEERGRDMEAVICLGHHPAISIGAQFVGPLEMNEIDIMGALLGEPVEMVQCETIDLQVPAYSEIAIEGIIRAGMRREEGPHAEGTGYYGKRRSNCVFEVTAITHRHDAIYPDIYLLGNEHGLLGEAGREPSLYRTLRGIVPQVQSVRFPDITRFVCYVQIKKEYDGLGKNAALATLAAEPLVEIAIVVDEDVNIYDDNEILWAIATRCDAGRSFSYIQDAAVLRLDPSSHDLKGNLEGGMKTKVIIDATKPVTIPFAERATPPEAWKHLKLEDYLPG